MHETVNFYLTLEASYPAPVIARITEKIGVYRFIADALIEAETHAANTWGSLFKDIYWKARGDTRVVIGVVNATDESLPRAMPTYVIRQVWEEVSS